MTKIQLNATQMLSLAIKIVSEKFLNKTDKSGEPYVLHCLRVMNDLHTHDKELQCIAVMHDLIEDTDVEPKDLRDLGFSNRIIEGVCTLTHIKTSDYMEYIKVISNSPDCVKVKLSDLKDNSNITRLKGLTKSDFERMEKYHTAYTYLSKI